MDAPGNERPSGYLFFYPMDLPETQKYDSGKDIDSTKKEECGKGNDHEGIVEQHRENDPEETHCHDRDPPLRQGLSTEGIGSPQEEHTA